MTLVNTTINWNSRRAKLTIRRCTLDTSTTSSCNGTDTNTISHLELGYCITNSCYWTNELVTRNKRIGRASPTLYQVFSALTFKDNKSLHWSTGEYQCHSYMQSQWATSALGKVKWATYMPQAETSTSTSSASRGRASKVNFSSLVLLAATFKGSNAA